MFNFGDRGCVFRMLQRLQMLALLLSYMEIQLYRIYMARTQNSGQTDERCSFNMSPNPSNLSGHKKESTSTRSSVNNANTSTIKTQDI